LKFPLKFFRWNFQRIFAFTAGRFFESWKSTTKKTKDTKRNSWKIQFGFEVFQSERFQIQD